LHNETAYCLAVEKLLGITDDVPERASVIRVMMMELNRISSHMTPKPQNPFSRCIRLNKINAGKINFSSVADCVRT
jgi:hypothetical protein